MLSTSSLQRAAQDARGAAGAREIRLRHDRRAEGADDDHLALPALRSEAHPDAADRGAPASTSRGKEKIALAAGRGGDDRARRGGRHARRRVDARSARRVLRGDDRGGATC